MDELCLCLLPLTFPILLFAFTALTNFDTFLDFKGSRLENLIIAWGAYSLALPAIVILFIALIETLFGTFVAVFLILIPLLYLAWLIFNIQALRLWANLSSSEHSTLIISTIGLIIEVVKWVVVIIAIYLIGEAASVDF